MFRQTYKCNHCHELLDPLTTDIDHIVEVRDGGDHDIDNLQALCVTCHRKKTMLRYTSGAPPSRVNAQ